MAKKAHVRDYQAQIIIPTDCPNVTQIERNVTEFFEQLGIQPIIAEDDDSLFEHNFIICLDSSRLIPDVKKAVDRLILYKPKNYCILYLRHYEKHALGEAALNTFDVFKEEDYLNKFGYTIDGVLNSKFEIYDCDANTKAGELIFRFLNRVRIHFNKSVPRPLQTECVRFVENLGVDFEVEEEDFIEDDYSLRPVFFISLGRSCKTEEEFLEIKDRLKKWCIIYLREQEKPAVFENRLYCVYKKNYQFDENENYKIAFLEKEICAERCAKKTIESVLKLIVRYKIPSGNIHFPAVTRLENKNKQLCDIDTKHDKRAKQLIIGDKHFRLTDLERLPKEVSDIHTANDMGDSQSKIKLEYSAYCRNIIVIAENNKGLLPLLLDKPWRDIGKIEFNKNSSLEDLKKEVRKLKPERKDFRMNIAVLGKVQAGKSSFINTVHSAFTTHVTEPAYAASSRDGVTSKYHQYSVDDLKCDHIRLCDTRGIEMNFGLSSTDFKNLIEGHIKAGYEFDENNHIVSGNPYFNDSPTFSDRMHCVCFVFDANKLHAHTEDEYKSVQEFLRIIGKDYDLRCVVLLTHLDQVCQLVATDVSKMYHSEGVREVVKQTAVKLGLDEKHIVPVVNYVSQTETSLSYNILVLIALRQILRRCDEFYKSYKKNASN